MGRFFVVSLGPVVRDLIVPRATEALAASDVIFLMTREGSRTHELVRSLAGDTPISLFMPASLKWGEWGGDPVHVRVAGEIAAVLADGRTASLIAFGDGAVYSPFAFMNPHLRRLGVEAEMVPGLPYFISASAVTGDILVRDEGNLLIVGEENVEDWDTAFAAASTVVVYAASRDGLLRIQRYARQQGLVSAQVVKVGAEGESSETVDLLTGPAKGNGGLVILKRDPRALMRVRDHVVAVADGPARRARTRIKDGVFRTVGEVELRYTAFVPGSPDPAPALLLWHGGGWQTGERHQFAAHGETLSALGLAVFTFDYRIRSKHGSTPMQAVEDARAAYLWVRENAEALGLDSERIVLGGASAGGHLALGVTMLAEGEPPPSPAAYVLFNPVTDTGPAGYGHDYMRDEIAEDPTSINVLRRLSERLAPAILFHGTADALVPIQNSLDFEARARGLGCDIRLYLYPDLPHGFFNHRFQGASRHYRRVLEQVVDFLVDLQMLPEAASLECRAIHERERLDALSDAAASDSQVTAALRDVDATLQDMQAALTTTGASGEPGAAESRRVLNNTIKALIGKLNQVRTISEYRSG